MKEETKFISKDVKTVGITEDDLSMLNAIRNYLRTKNLPFNETVHGNLFLDKFIQKINDA